MRVYRNIREVEYDRNTAVTVGTFDGVHLGHREIISKLERTAESKGLRKLVVTFEPHPQIILRSKSPDIKVLSTLDEKIGILGSLNIDSVLVIEFTKEFSQTGAEDFYKEYLINGTGISDLVLGYDHMFGRNREGNFEMMSLLSGKYGFTVDRVDEFRSEGEHVSSTRIRHMLEAGDVRNAARMLGSEYSLSGTVTEGRKLGRELGMPTANIIPDSEFKLIPLDGIYAVKVSTDGDEYGGVMNIGTNPTVTDDMSKKLEVNIFDFDGDLYGKKLTVSFVDRLRAEEKFTNLDDLRSAMQADKAKAGEILRKKTEMEFNNKITKAN